MDAESAFKPAIAAAGLLAGVGAAWGLLFLDGSFDSDWMLAGFLAAGLGFLLVHLIDRARRRFAGPESEAEDAATEPATVPKPRGKEAAPAPSDEEAAPSPRLRVLVISSCLEAVAVALITSYYTESVVLSLAAGVVAGALAIGVSFLLARNLTPA
jgi:hypothetical protein